jgi:hypothetical protein
MSFENGFFELWKIGQVLTKKYELYAKTLPHTYSRTFKKMKIYFIHK